MQLSSGTNCNAQRLLFSSKMSDLSPIQSSSSSSSPSPLLVHQRNNLSFNCTYNGGRRAVSPTMASSGVERKNLESPTKALRRLLDSPGLHQGPACFDALSAKLVEKAGFDFCFTSGVMAHAYHLVLGVKRGVDILPLHCTRSHGYRETDLVFCGFGNRAGFSISAARLGLPDVGLISYGEMVDQGQKITDAVSIPVIGDGDNGYGNAMNVKRTVKGYIKAGFAGIILEDQVSPKACGHTRGRKVVPIDEAVMRIKAAVDARRESGSDIVIVARTDSRQAVSLEESLRRSRAFVDAGADVLFIDALTSRDEMKAFCSISPLVPKMANMLEGGGKTPILTPVELEEIGYKLVAYPLSLIGVSIQAMQDALNAIRKGRIPSPGSMPSFEEIKDNLGFDEYYEEEKKYALTTTQRAVGNDYSLIKREQGGLNDSRQSRQNPPSEVIIPEVYSNSGADGSRGVLGGIWSRTLRIKITGRDGFERLDVRIPAGFLDGITNIVPALVGVNIKELLDNAVEGEQGKLLDFNDTLGDRIQVFLE